VHSTLIVARFDPETSGDVAKIFATSTTPTCPTGWARCAGSCSATRACTSTSRLRRGQRRRAHRRAREDVRFKQISADLKPFMRAYDPETWRSPADAMATRFYTWEQQA